MAFKLYKPGQGKNTRKVTFAVGTLIGAGLAYEVSFRLGGTDLSPYLVFGIPLAIFVGVAVLMFWIVNRPTSADFMIATEGEMKKVSWSSKAEVIGGTKVVIVTSMILAVILLAVDLAFSFCFRLMGVLKIGEGG